MKKYVNHDYKHLVGKDYPLYGIKTRVPKNKNPKFNRMSQLAALVALEIVNEGDGKANGEANIEIRNVSYEVKNENIVGGFKVDITGDEPSFANGTSPANKTTVTIVDDSDKDSFISIAPGDSAKIYFAVKPHDASGKSVTITVNGSSRTITMPANTKFKMGQATTIRVPVSLSYPKESDLIGKKSNGKDMITMPVAATPLQVNGEKVDAYVIGDGALQTVKIYGTVVDLFKALDAGFYVSSWKDRPAAMTVSKINLWIDGDPFYSYEPLQNAIADEISGDHWALNGLTLWAVVPLVMSTFEDGVTRDTDMMHLTQFIDPQTITFNGVVSNGSEGGDIMILDESPIYKELGSDAIDNLLTTKFMFNDESPSFVGLKYIIDGKTSEPEAQSTARIIYNKLLKSFEERGSMSKSVDTGIPFVNTVSVSMNLVSIFNALISSPEDLMTKLQSMTVEVEISTCPYHQDKAKGYGSKKSPIALDKIQGDKNPLIFWGLDGYGSDSSAPLVAE